MDDDGDLKCVSLLFRKIRENQIRTFSCERDGHCAAYTAVSARNYSDLAQEFAGSYITAFTVIGGGIHSLHCTGMTLLLFSKGRLWAYLAWVWIFWHRFPLIERADEAEMPKSQI
jgi:hypothetical protein